ncbi:hypothetical protein ACM9HF_04485 [Colwellia sp. RE-S-Sl-9]
MKVFIFAVIFFIAGCSTTNQKDKVVKKQYEGLTMKQYSSNLKVNRYCAKYAVDVMETYLAAKHGLTKNLVSLGPFMTWETVKELEDLAKAKENIDLVQGYYFGRCMRNHHDIETPSYLELKPLYNQCLTNENIIMACASTVTVKFSS